MSKFQEQLNNFPHTMTVSGYHTLSIPDLISKPVFKCFLFEKLLLFLCSPWNIIPFIFPLSISVQSINYYNSSLHLSDRASYVAVCFIFRCWKYFFAQIKVHLSRDNGIDTQNFYTRLQTHGALGFVAWD